MSVGRIVLATVALVILVPLSSRGADPEWIWINGQPAADEVAHFRKSFVLDDEVKSAVLAVACDDEAVLFVNDQQTARHNSPKQVAFAGVSERLRKGTNVIAARCSNGTSAAGLLVRLEVELKDGTKQVVVSDGSWKVSKRPQRGWQEPDFNDTAWSKPHVFGKVGVAPWGKLSLDPSAQPLPKATPAERIALAPGFKAELLYSVPSLQQGSWVSMAVDPKGRLVVSDQDGALYRVTVGPSAKDTQVERLQVAIGMAHGLLFAFDNLYVVVNGGAAQGSGLYRVRDTNGDDQFDEVKLLRKIEGGGEHGPHAVVPGPDGQTLYVVGGNHTKIPNPESTRLPKTWDEDQLLPRMWDAGGHAVGVMAPGGWICRTDPEGKSWELVSSGYRNAYDIAFNPAGELFTYDSDMEWDIGSPWYRATRVNHATSGSEFGWRSGSGKWPSYFPDSLPATVDIGPGSPTGIVFGTGAKFPAKYQQAMFINDWSYGNIYAVHLTLQGSSYSGEFERFATAAPLPVTDIVVRPQDGALYFAIGGRRTQSGLYRVTYTGSESTAPVALGKDAGSEARATRHKLEAFHGMQDPRALEVAWPYLSDPDRFIRYAARVAIENQPVASWQDKALRETNPTASITAILALARSGDKTLQPQAISSLGRINWKDLSLVDQLGLLRAYGLVFIRFGEPSSDIRQQVLGRFDKLFPAPDALLNRELSRLLIYLEAPNIAGRCLDQMAKASTQEEGIHYAFSLRSLKSGWTLDQRRAYFDWFNQTGKFRGGHSFSLFLRNAKNEAVEFLSEKDKSALASVIETKPMEVDPSLEFKNRPLVREWTLSELSAGIDQALQGRDFQKGREMFAAAACFKCHRFAAEGGIIGPDLTGVGKRFNNQYLVESLIEPNKTISDQYQATVFVLKDGRTVVGKIANLQGNNLNIITNMLEPGTMTGVRTNEIDEQHPSPVSMMPNGLLNTLNRDEILDLLAYLRSGGGRDSRFARVPAIRRRPKPRSVSVGKL